MIKKPLFILILLTLGIIFFLVINNGQFDLPVDPKNEFGLRNKHSKLTKLIDNKDYKALYKLFAPSGHEQYTEEEFVEGFTKLESNRKNAISRKYTINSITIKDNTGFIDLTSTSCYDENCVDNLTVRQYQKWVYVNNHWHFTFDSPSCIRDVPYNKPPEFERAISLIKQRIPGWWTKTVGSKYEESIFNCVNIQYSDLKNYGDGPEGVFYFDNSISSPENLLILVDNSYQIKDDLLTAILLVHELTHAGQFLSNYFDGIKLSCIDNEAYAFYNELNFMVSLNAGEMAALNARIRDSFLVSYNRDVEGIQNLALIRNQSMQACQSRGLPNDTDCIWDITLDKVKSMVASNPYYQQQCNL